MQTTFLLRGTRALLLALAAGVGAQAIAVPLMDMRPDDLAAMAPEFRKALNLNANQQTLWQQVEGRTRAVLRERHARRERLQQQSKALLERPGVELRELGQLVEAEEAASVAENRQLREAWLTLNDALDDKQRAQVANFVAEQIARVAEPPMGRREGRPEGRGEGGPHRGGTGGHGGARGGGGMGM